MFELILMITLENYVTALKKIKSNYHFYYSGVFKSS